MSVRSLFSPRFSLSFPTPTVWPTLTRGGYRAPAGAEQMAELARGRAAAATRARSGSRSPVGGRSGGGAQPRQLPCAGPTRGGSRRGWSGEPAMEHARDGSGSLVGADGRRHTHAAAPTRPSGGGAAAEHAHGGSRSLAWAERTVELARGDGATAAHTHGGFRSLIGGRSDRRPRWG
ncbi:hypothetical protein PAHAL_3G295500 [Panicum hallii]|uniref:Uncharacterized protein n=1 Tax=Panicum hallii TaxID=206008 RepID=A0A2T8KJU1_9POAL|nr:hypothetical protein PAHAL_3G295500 [Panicum hallii]